MWLTIIVFIAVLSILVFAHELGHFWTARRFGVKAEEFGFGFPPRLGGVYKNKAGKWKFVWGTKKVEDAIETVYSLNWLPLGGFVKIKGEQGDHKEENDSFASQAIWKRCIILTAGVVMNLVLAAVFLAVGFWLGLPQSLDSIDDRAQISEQNIQIMQVLSDSPAEIADLQLGDIVISINDEKFTTTEDVQNFVATKERQELTYEILRGEETLALNIIPEYREDTGQAGIGVAIAETGLVSYPWYWAIWEGIKATVFMTWYIILAFFNLFKDLIIGQGAGIEVSGPVGIAVITGRFARLGFVYLLQFTALLSINLAIINYLPFPALDGGRVLFLIIEKIRGKAVPEKVEAIFHNLGFALLMILVLIVTFRDVIKFF